jgi:hypothetical protein
MAPDTKKKSKKRKCAEEPLDFYVPPGDTPFVPGPSRNAYTHFDLSGSGISSRRKTLETPASPRKRLVSDNRFDVSLPPIADPGFEAQLLDPDFMDYIADLEPDTGPRLRTESVSCVASAWKLSC